VEVRAILIGAFMATYPCIYFETHKSTSN